VVMTHDAEEALLGNSAGPLAVGPVLPDADTRMPDAPVGTSGAVTAPVSAPSPGAAAPVTAAGPTTPGVDAASPAQH